jgi:hypothetical protein
VARARPVRERHRKGKDQKTHLDGRLVLAHPLVQNLPHPLSRRGVELPLRRRLLLDMFGEVGGRKEESFDGGNKFRGDLVVAFDGEGAEKRERAGQYGRTR